MCAVLGRGGSRVETYMETAQDNRLLLTLTRVCGSMGVGRDAQLFINWEAMPFYLQSHLRHSHFTFTRDAPAI